MCAILEGSSSPLKPFISCGKWAPSMLLTLSQHVGAGWGTENIILRVCWQAWGGKHQLLNSRGQMKSVAPFHLSPSRPGCWV